MKGREGVLKGETGRRALDACVMSLYAALVSLVLGVVVLAYGRVDFYLKALRGEAALGHVPLMLIGAALLALALALTARLGRARVERLLGRYGAWLLAAGTLLMLAAQVFVCYHAYFMGVGDDGYFVFNTAMGYARREYTSVENAYLELYPNNATLAGVYGLMLRAVMALLGVEPGVERFRVLLILMQSAVNVTSGVLIAHLARVDGQPYGGCRGVGAVRGADRLLAVVPHPVFGQHHARRAAAARRAVHARGGRRKGRGAVRADGAAGRRGVSD